MSGLLKIHYYLAFLALALLVIISIYSVYAKLRGSGSLRWGKGLSRLMISTLHIQAALGFVLMIDYISLLQGSGVSFGDVMKNGQLRYKLVEHPFMMVLAVILATMAHIKLKKGGLSSKVATLFVLALVALLSRLPFDRMFG